MSFKLEIISPQNKIFDDEIDLCIMPGTEGDFGILKNHMPFYNDSSPRYCIHLQRKKIN